MHLHTIASDFRSFSVLCKSQLAHCLIDAGFTPEQWHLAEVRHGWDASLIQDVLITHEHEDHVRGLSWWLHEMASPDTRVWCDAETWAALKLPASLQKHWQAIPESGHFSAYGLEVRAVSVAHDAASPRAYQLTQGASQTLVAVDLGSVTQKLRECLAECDQAFLSAYYEEDLLPAQDDSGAAQRLSSLHGHLSNRQIGAWLQEAGGKLTHLSLGHRHPRWNSRHHITARLLPFLPESVVLQLF